MLFSFRHALIIAAKVSGMYAFEWFCLWVTIPHMLQYKLPKKGGSMSEIKSFNVLDRTSPEAPAERLELSEQEVDARFAEIMGAEESLAAVSHEEREHRETTLLYKPSQGYDINSMKAAG
jgi:hypothetical protein